MNFPKSLFRWPTSFAGAKQPVKEVKRPYRLRLHTENGTLSMFNRDTGEEHIIFTFPKEGDQ